jgi:cell fate regulator YaaT (PSP1 superfamily)
VARVECGGREEHDDGAGCKQLVYFSAPHRGGFRALVRDLGGLLKARVELRQIGPRDETRLQGGIGPAGTCAAPRS